MNVVSFDIETIPYRGDLFESQKEELEKKMKQQENKTPTDTVEDLGKLRNKVMATNPYLGEIICISLYYVGNDDPSQAQVASLIGDEKQILKDFWDFMKTYNGLFVSFNGLTFDVPFILKRSMFHKILPTNNSFLDQRRYSRYPHFDVRSIAGNFDNYATGNLDLLCEFLGVPSPKRGDIKAENVFEAFTQGRIKEIASYCEDDVRATYQVYRELKNYTYMDKKLYIK